MFRVVNSVSCTWDVSKGLVVRLSFDVAKASLKLLLGLLRLLQSQQCFAPQHWKPLC